VIRHAFPAKPIRVERVAEGGSTYVYRLTTEHERFYLRVLPEEGASFLPEVEVHRRLRENGVTVPEVVYFESINELVQRSIMVTTEIPGTPISGPPYLSPIELERIVEAAGEDLARINSVVVNGFGWIERGTVDTGRLQAPWPTYRAFALEFWETDLAYLESTILSRSEILTLEQIVDRHAGWLDSGAGSLVHGDFDPTHIFQEVGRYTGIIDFGEIRGADHWYDLGHFHMRDREHLPAPLESSLVRGYGHVIALPPDYPTRIRLASLLINVRALSRSLQKQPLNQFTRHQVAVLREDLLAFH
jgi:aminoglycoside phosphotransferase (APT) family kinase protein